MFEYGVAALLNISNFFVSLLACLDLSVPICIGLRADKPLGIAVLVCNRFDVIYCGLSVLLVCHCISHSHHWLWPFVFFHAYFSYQRAYDWYSSYILPAKYMEYFLFQRFFVFCGVCKVFIYLIYIPTNRYYFWGVNSHSIAKWTANVQK